MKHETMKQDIFKRIGNGQDDIYAQLLSILLRK